MRKAFAALAAAGVIGFIFAGIRDIESAREPITADDVSLITPGYQWDLTKVYYQQVRMPDGSKVELKSRIPLTEKQWKELAVSVYVKPDPNEPETCPYCGQVIP